MKATLVAGLKAELRHVVQPEELLSAVYPGGPPVFATPFVLGLMEHASARAIQPHLDAGEASVGYGFEFQNLVLVTLPLMARPIGLQGESDTMRGCVHYSPAQRCL